jgi:PTH1 family peptidyl-tRNA hydrolase
MKLIVGLGNPGKEYESTRHNVGFYMVGRLAEAEHAQWGKKSRLQGSVAQIADKDVILFRPLTYMNASGEAIRKVADYYKVADEDILIIHDDADMDFGKLRAVSGGSDGGHKGIQSLHGHGLDGTWRLKVGVANDQRLPGQAIDFVLKDFNADERRYLPQLAEPVIRLCRDLMAGRLERHTRHS